jgi:hypothetical protein
MLRVVGVTPVVQWIGTVIRTFSVIESYAPVFDGSIAVEQSSWLVTRGDNDSDIGKKVHVAAYSICCCNVRRGGMEFNSN